jgi:hypothetical protein
MKTELIEKLKAIPQIKEGDDRLRLGVLRQPPLVACRLISEDLFQEAIALLEKPSENTDNLDMYKKYKDAYPNKSDALIIEALGNELKQKVETIHNLLEKPRVSAEECYNKVIKSLPQDLSAQEEALLIAGIEEAFKYMHDYAGHSDATKERLINFHIEVMKLGLINEGSKKWSESYEPFVRKQASDYYDQAFLNREEK